jgi:hypothetical protein
VIFTLRHVLWPGAKLAPFYSGGVSQNCPAKTDNALQQIFISGHCLSQKCWHTGGGGGVGKKFSGHTPAKLSIKKLFPFKFLGETILFEPISVKFRSIN